MGSEIVAGIVDVTKNSFFSKNTQLYCLTSQLHVSATVSSHHQA
jgi:hypothetical protein